VPPATASKEVITLLRPDAVFKVYDRLAEAVDTQAGHVDRPRDAREK
jgi:hypothetical protein